jgi:hypothetical protein
LKPSAEYQTQALGFPQVISWRKHGTQTKQELCEEGSLQTF